MSSKARQAHRLMCNEIIASAERKLGRKLSVGEQSAIMAIPSLMLLESIARRFDYPGTKAAEIEEDLNAMMRR